MENCASCGIKLIIANQGDTATVESMKVGLCELCHLEIKEIARLANIKLAEDLDIKCYDLFAVADHLDTIPWEQTSFPDSRLFYKNPFKLSNTVA